MAKKKAGLSPIAIIIWVLITVVCIQGFFLFGKQYAEKAKAKVTDVLKKTAKTQPGTTSPVPAQSRKKAGPVVGRIAIVLDDWGYNKTHCSYLAAMPEPVGVAVLPHLPYSHDVIACAKESGKAPMLHLPLEPFNHKEMFDAGYVLTTDMTPAEAKKTLVKILDEMPGVVGVNNHTGSKGSEDEELMTLVLSEVNRRGLFFLDSVTSQKTVGAKVAARLKMRIAKRDVFLDNRNERAAIEHQFDQLASDAREKGFALAIGHDRVLTMQILTEQMKKLTNEGFEFVSVKDYIKQNEYPRH